MRCRPRRSARTQKDRKKEPAVLEQCLFWEAMLSKTLGQIVRTGSSVMMTPSLHDATMAEPPAAMFLRASLSLMSGRAPI